MLQWSKEIWVDNRVVLWAVVRGKWCTSRHQVWDPFSAKTHQESWEVSKTQGSSRNFWWCLLNFSVLTQSVIVEVCLEIHHYFKDQSTDIPNTWVQSKQYSQTRHRFVSTSLKIYRANLPALKPGQYSSLSSPLVRWAIIILSITVKLGVRRIMGESKH